MNKIRSVSSNINIFFSFCQWKKSIFNETVTENTPVAETSEVLEATDNTEPTDTVQDTAKSPETNPHTLTLND